MGEKSVIIAYIFWFFGGLFGLHHFYLGRDRQAFVWWCLLAGYGGIGFFNDIFSIPRYVEEANFSQTYVRKLTEMMQKHKKPPFSFYRFFGQILFGNLLAWLFFRAIPNPNDLTIFGYPLTWLEVFIPLASAIGVHTVGCIGRHKGEFLSAFLGAYSVSPLYDFSNPRYYLSSIASSIAYRYRLKWNRQPPKRSKLSKRLLVLGCCALLYSSLWASNFYFNVTITNEYGETIKLRDSIKNLLNSPMWIEFKNSMQKLWEFYWARGWNSLWDELIRNLDPFGEEKALATLGLSNSASQINITKKWRELSRKYHPDKFHSEKDKLEAQIKFLEFKEAYEKISVLQSRRREQRSKSDQTPQTA